MSTFNDFGTRGPSIYTLAEAEAMIASYGSVIRPGTTIRISNVGSAPGTVHTFDGTDWVPDFGDVPSHDQDLSTITGLQDALDLKANSSSLATVATSGSFADLTGIPAAADSHLLNIDRRRTDTYVADGSADRPFKTIAAAVAQAIANGDGGTTPYSFVIAEGTYAEEINLNGTGLSNISIIGLGRVAIDPTSGNALTCTTSNNNLLQLAIRNVEFADPVVITGNSTTNQFNNVTFYDVSLAGLTATCMNSLNIRGAYISGNVTLSNVAWGYWIDVQQDPGTAVLSITSDTTATQPAWGMANAGMFFVSSRLRDFTFVRTGTGNFNMNLNHCFGGAGTNAYTVPTGFTVNMRNSTLGGVWTNNGAMNLFSSTVTNPILGAAPTYAGVIAPAARSGAPSNIGAPGDVAGQLRFDSGKLYVCVANYDGVATIWTEADLTPVV